MQKIISLFQRNYTTDRLVRDEVVDGAQWVLAGEGRATQKFDGTACLVRDSALWKRYELKRGRPAPLYFIAAQDPDDVTGDIPGWVPVTDYPEDRWHREAWQSLCRQIICGGVPDGTYELVGPKVQGNPECVDAHLLWPHGCITLAECPRDFQGIRTYLATHDIEGIVWHHEDGRRAKIKQRDFGQKRRATIP